MNAQKEQYIVGKYITNVGSWQIKQSEKDIVEQVSYLFVALCL